MAILICLGLALVAVTGVVGGIATGFAARGRQWSAGRHTRMLNLVVFVLFLMCGCVAQFGLHLEYRGARVLNDHWGIILVFWPISVLMLILVATIVTLIIGILCLALAMELAKPIARKIAAPK